MTEGLTASLWAIAVTACVLVAATAFLTPERSLSRKFKEALYTLWLEARFNKEQILEAYLNRIYLGSGSYGVDAAARRYVDKPARELSLAESAMLAGLIRKLRNV